MNDQALLRYSRHLLLPQIGEEGQERLLNATALIVGCGGLGSPAAMYLASSGVGTLILMDPDVVELTNLQRQIAHATSRLGQSKVDSTAQTLRDLNPEVQVQAHPVRARDDNLPALVQQADIVLDCTDNFQTRHLINRVCRAHAKPLVSAAAVGLDAQVSVFDPAFPDGPCYACVFPEQGASPDAACATLGVLAPWVGVAGSLQASAAMEHLVQGRSTLAGRLALLRAWPLSCEFVHLGRNASCEVCGKSTSDC